MLFYTDCVYPLNDSFSEKQQIRKIVTFYSR